MFKNWITSVANSIRNKAEEVKATQESKTMQKAQIEKYLPILFRWEAGIVMKNNETIEEAFNRAKKTGWSDDPQDNGGATMIGVTIGTYKTYCKNIGKKTPTKTDLKNIPYK